MPEVSEPTSFEERFAKLSQSEEDANTRANAPRVRQHYRASPSEQELAVARAQTRLAEAEHESILNNLVNLVVDELIQSPENLTHARVFEIIEKRIKLQEGSMFDGIRRFTRSGLYNWILQKVMIELGRRLREKRQDPSAVYDFNEIKLRLAEDRRTTWEKVLETIRPSMAEAKAREIAIEQLAQALKQA